MTSLMVRLSFAVQIVKYNMPMLRKKILFIRGLTKIVDVSKVGV